MLYNGIVHVMTKKDKFVEIQPVLDALDIIGGKWKFPVIYSLCPGKKRFSELEKDLNGVTPRALTSVLKDLEVNGIVKREVFATVPVTVEYSLTEYGKDLKPVLGALHDWGRKHRTKMMSNKQEPNT